MSNRKKKDITDAVVCVLLRSEFMCSMVVLPAKKATDGQAYVKYWIVIQKNTPIISGFVVLR